MRIESYDIKKISTWLLVSEGEIKLPAIQRGFVWKAYQMENLWDSIFRGYPVGSFLLAEGNSHKELFDGQQRATSIALGFYDPWDTHRNLNRIGNAKTLPVIWVDLEPAVDSLPEASTHLFRVLTKSHPWGYRSRFNYEKMHLQDRSEGWKQIKAAYGADRYTALADHKRLPYSSRVPVPLCFLFKAFKASKEDEAPLELFAQVIIRLCRKYLPETFHPYWLEDEDTYFDTLSKVNFEKWYDRVKTVIQNYVIPGIVVPSEILSYQSHEQAQSEDPTLFVRLNSGGTNLQGEELIYSIFKSYYPESVNLVEGIASEVKSFNLVSPSRLVVLAARLALSKIGERSGNSGGGSYPDKINSRRFLSLLSGNHAFKTNLTGFVGTETFSPLAALFRRMVDILRKGGEIPDIIVKAFIRENLEGVLLVLHFLESHEEPIPEDLRNAICRKLYRNYWFGDWTKLVKAGDNWSAAACEEFWRKDEMKTKGLYQLPLVSPDRLETFLLSRITPSADQENHSIDPTTDPQIWNFIERYLSDDGIEDAVRIITESWQNFLWRLLSSGSNRSRSLIVLAQRKFIKRVFEDYNQLEDLDDTDTPWDWDHIFPYSWVNGGWWLTKQWENRIGNFRAMSLIDNRSENNMYSPWKRFSEESFEGDHTAFEHALSDYFIDKNRDYPYWVQLTQSYSTRNGRNNEDFRRIHAKAIILRSVNIYRNFYELFQITDDIDYNS